MLAAAREFASTPPQTHPRAQHLAWIFHTRSADFQSAVSQNCILRAVGNAQDAEPLRTPCRLKIGDTADYKSALRRWQQPRRDIAFHRRLRRCEMFGLGGQGADYLRRSMIAIMIGTRSDGDQRDIKRLVVCGSGGP